MTRFNNSDVESALAAEHVVFVIAARLDFTSGTVRAHLGRGSVTIGGNEYLGVGVAGNGGFGSISAIQERPDARDYSQIQIGLSGVDPTMIGRVPDRSEYRGKYAAIYIFPMDPVTYQPIDPDIGPRAEGFIDTMTYQRTQGSASIGLTINSFDSLFQKSIGLTFTDQSQKSLGAQFAGDPHGSQLINDSFFDTVPLVQNIQLFWGGFPARVGTPVSPNPGWTPGAGEKPR